MRPEHVRHQQHRLGPAAKFAGELIGRIRQIFRQRQAVGVARRHGVVKVMAVVVAQLDAVNADLRIDVNQRRSQVEGAFQRLKLVRTRAPFRIVRLRIGFAGNKREHDGLVERLHMLECALQHIPRAIDVVLARHAGHGAESEVWIIYFESRLKFAFRCFGLSSHRFRLLDLVFEAHPFTGGQFEKSTTEAQASWREKYRSQKG